MQFSIFTPIHSAFILLSFLYPLHELLFSPTDTDSRLPSDIVCTCPLLVLLLLLLLSLPSFFICLLSARCCAGSEVYAYYIFLLV